jgi:transcriptional regulator with XRE-family HTH domain
MTPDQLRTARALLGWGLKRLAARSGTSIQMVTVFEQTGRVMSLNSRFRTVPTDAVAAIRTALEAAGVEFTNGDEPGVKLRKADQ